MNNNLTSSIVTQEFFGPANLQTNSEFITQAIDIERSAQIERHSFFSLANSELAALKFWVSQEAVVTNPFSQVLFSTLSHINNVHVRALLMPVVSGEHGSFVNGIAKHSHPWLIWNLCKSIGIDYEHIKCSKAVTEFIHTLRETSSNPMRSLGALGIGNELMLLAEYKAIEHSFELQCPHADYKAFLHGNITEDEHHTKLIEMAATALANSGFSERDFLEGAEIGVRARVKYYDQLQNEYQFNNK